MTEQVSHNKLEWKELNEEREAVLAGWPTGQEVDLEEAFQFHLKLAPELNFAKRLIQAKQQGHTLAQPRAECRAEQAFRTPPFPAE